MFTRIPKKTVLFFRTRFNSLPTISVLVKACSGLILKIRFPKVVVLCKLTRFGIMTDEFGNLFKFYLHFFFNSY